MSADNEVLWIVRRMSHKVVQREYVFRTRDAARQFVRQRRSSGSFASWVIKSATWGP
jgi:hypothetical protein